MVPRMRIPQRPPDEQPVVFVFTGRCTEDPGVLLVSLPCFTLTLHAAKAVVKTMRKRKPTNGRVAGVKFALKPGTEDNDLKQVKARLLKELEEKEQEKKEWYDKELEKNLNR